MDDFDYEFCYECGGYGDDYFINDEGELECRCPTKMIRKRRLHNGL